jgi:hypothetical protein
MAGASPTAAARAGTGRARVAARVLAGLALLLAAAGPAGAQRTDAERQSAAMTQTVIEQLEAFRRGDWPTAYGFASSTIRSRFTPEAFREMVTRSYAPIARPLQSRILATRVVDAQLGFVEIRVEGQNGDTVDAVYELVEEQGAWRINGVIARPVERGPLAATLPVRPGSAWRAAPPSPGWWGEGATGEWRGVLA